MPFEKGLGSAAISFGASGGRPRWRSRRLPPSGFIDAGGGLPTLLWGALSVAPAFQPKEVFRRAGLRSFFLRGAAVGGLACGSSVGRIRDSFAGTRPSAIGPFYRATEDVSSETFFEADGRRRTCLGAGMKPDRSAGGVRYAVVPEPLRVLSVAYATACGGTGRRDFLFGAIWDRRLVPRPIRTAAGRSDGRTGPEREDRLLATRQRRAEAPVAPTAVRRLAAIVRGTSGLLSSRTLLSIRCGGSAEGPAADMPGERGIERDGTERSPRFRIFGTK